MAHKQHDFFVRFWGVRGTVPTPGLATARYGGNTSCVEVRCGGRLIVFDAGTGLYPLGESAPIEEADILLSHTHMDHIQGFPFFSPAYNPKARLRVWAGHLAPEGTVRDALSRLISPPIFPLTLDYLKAGIDYIDFRAGETLTLPGLNDVAIKTLPLNHPGNATAYRVEQGGHSVCYVTDVEHRPGELDEALLAFIRKTDVFIYDCTFSDENFSRYAGWGHSTWQHAVRLANAAEVGTLVLFHHDPGMTDDALDERHQLLLQQRPQSTSAHEGMTIPLREGVAKIRAVY